MGFGVQRRDSVRQLSSNNQTEQYHRPSNLQQLVPLQNPHQITTELSTRLLGGPFDSPQLTSRPLGLTFSQRFFLQQGQEESQHDSFDQTGGPFGSSVHSVEDIQYVRFEDKEIPQHDKGIDNTLIQRHRFLASKTWLIDVEFFVLSKGKEFVPMQLAVWTMDGWQILFCSVKYDMNRQELWEQVKDFANVEDASHNAVEKRQTAFLKMFDKYYDNNQTNTYGLTFSEIQKVLLNSGWTSDHIFVSYSDSHDISIMNKIMGGETSIVIDRYPAKNVIDVIRLVKAMKPDLHSHKLQVIHESYYPRRRGKKVIFHQAAWDVCALYQVIMALICVTPSTVY